MFPSVTINSVRYGFVLILCFLLIEKVATIHRRFYSALILNDLVHEMPLAEVAKRYHVNRGTLQAIQSAASTFAGMVTAFCSKLQWKNLELLIKQFEARLGFGVEIELVELASLHYVKGFRARALFNAGIKTVEQLAESDVGFVSATLLKALPFRSNHDGAGSLFRIRIETRAAQLIVKNAKQIVGW